MNLETRLSDQSLHNDYAPKKIRSIAVRTTAECFRAQSWLDWQPGWKFLSFQRVETCGRRRLQKLPVALEVRPIHTRRQYSWTSAPQKIESSTTAPDCLS